MERTTLSFNARCSSLAINLTARLDKEIIYSGTLESAPREISYTFDDADGVHVLSLIMAGKMPDHTITDQQGNILQDHVIEIIDFAFDDIQLGSVFTRLAVYEHDFNGSGQKTQEQFYGIMGCNGTVSFKFTTPIYLWMLENM